MIIIYGIPNCDTVKKAQTWLKNNNIDFEFYDYKKRGIDSDKLNEWLKVYDITKLINRSGSTWRQLTDEQKAKITDNASAIELMISKPSIIKRPLVEKDGKAVVLGFSITEFEKIVHN